MLGLLILAGLIVASWLTVLLGGPDLLALVGPLVSRGDGA